MSAGHPPLAGSFGGKDLTLRGAAANQLERALDTPGIDHDLAGCADTGHSFLNDHRSVFFQVMGALIYGGYHPPSAEDARRRILFFFNHHLTSPI